MKGGKEKMTRFKDLSFWLKVAVLAAWYEAAAFTIGFILGFLSVL